MTKKARRRILLFILATAIFLTLAIPLFAQLGGLNLVGVVSTLDSSFSGTDDLGGTSIFSGTSTGGTFGTPMATPTN